MAEISKLYLFMLIVFSLTPHSMPTNAARRLSANPLATPTYPSELSLAPAPETEYDSLSPYSAPPLYAEDLALEAEDLAPETGDKLFSPESSPAFAPEFGDDILSPEYSSPSPSPYVGEEALAPAENEDDSFSPPEYSSPPPYIQVMAPEVETDGFYSPLEAPVLPPTTPEADADQFAPHPSVLPFNYSAEDDAFEVEQESEGSWGGKKNGNAVGFIIGAVCFVGLGGLLYKKKKNDDNRKYQYLGKRGESN